MGTNAVADQLGKDGQPTEALKMYQRAEVLSEQTGKPAPGFSLQSALNQGTAYQKIGEYDKALHFANRALDLAREANNVEAEASALKTLGNIYGSLDNAGGTESAFDQAVTNYQSAIDLYANKIKNEAERTETMLSLGNLYQDKS